ncbi:transcriptional regulator [Gammaproteobacteria bacterium ESL0073]|nr:transcriptional regulator [Gammaproteobacteria bacterium ESL0073]
MNTRSWRLSGGYAVTNAVKSAKKTKQTQVNKQSDTSNELALNHVIGKAIAKYRKQAALSQEQLAEALGIGYEAVSRMERGVVIPTLDRLIAIADIVNCPVTELLSQSSPRPTDEVVHLHQLLCSLSSENKQWLMEQIEAWVQKLK